MPNKSTRIQQLQIRITVALHAPSLANPPPNREHHQQD